MTGIFVDVLNQPWARIKKTVIIRVFLGKQLLWNHLVSRRKGPLAQWQIVMKQVGQKTDSMHRRCQLVDERDLLTVKPDDPKKESFRRRAIEVSR